MSNRLANETSPYLLQHSENPVDWYPWGDEALDAAIKLNKPILLSVGYSSCHWCHVMERESFEDVETAVIMNSNFINIKVDREERPDIDNIYMQAVLAQNGHGGWPMTVFLTPETKPFYSGTYFPPAPRHGMPSFKQVLEAMSNAFYNKFDEIQPLANKLTEHISFEDLSIDNQDIDTKTLINKSLIQLSQEYDSNFGGFGNAPKFPQPTILNYLLEIYYSTQNNQYLQMVLHTLNNMACGGIYDQLGGGFHRYSTDPNWLVPHFEKMLYDNALITSIYVDAYKITNNSQYLRIVKETLDYILQEMTGDNFEFYSSQDADTEGVEGRYFTWDKSELDEILGSERSLVFCKYYGVTEEGNFENTNILNIKLEHSQLANSLNITSEELSTIIEKCRTELLQHRFNRVQPLTDHKIITSWNAMMAKSFAKASVFLGKRYLNVAIDNINFLLDNHYVNDQLLHTNNTKNPYGYLEDYVFLLDTILTIHSITLDYSWIEKTQQIVNTMIAFYWDSESKRFYDTAMEQSDLIYRPRDVHDGVIPSPHSVVSEVLNKLSVYLDQKEYSNISDLNIESMFNLIDKGTYSFTNWLTFLNRKSQKTNELIISYPQLLKQSSEILGLGASVNKHFLPNLLISGINQYELEKQNTNVLYAGKTLVDQKITGYYCTNFICEQPTTNLEALMTIISREDKPLQHHGGGI